MSTTSRNTFAGTFYQPDGPSSLQIERSLPEVRHDAPLCAGGLWDEALFADDRWGRLSLPLPVLHPAAACWVAPSLGVSATSLLALARGEAWWQGGQVVLPPGRCWGDGRTEPLWSWPPRLCWPPPAPGTPAWADQQLTLTLSSSACTGWQAHALEETGHQGLRHLPGAALTWVVPIPPPRLRPLQRRPGGQRLPGLDNIALAALVRQRNRLQRMLELQAPPQVIRAEHRTLQLAVEELLRVVGQPSAAPVTPQGGWHPAGAPPLHPTRDLPDPLTPTGCALLPDGTAMFSMAYASIHLRLTDGVVLASWPSAGLRLLGQVPTAAPGGLILYDRAADWGIHARHSRTGGWLEQVPAEVSALPLPILAPGDQRVVSACGRFVWTRSGPVMGSGGLSVALPWWAVGATGAQAFVLDPSETWVFVDGEHLHRPGQPPLSLGSGVQVAALDAQGQHLLTVQYGQAMLYRMVGHTLLPLHGVDLRTLRPLLGGAQPDMALRAALFQYGTLAALADATDVAGAVRVGDALHGYRALTPAEVHHLHLLSSRRAVA